MTSPSNSGTKSIAASAPAFPASSPAAAAASPSFESNSRRSGFPAAPAATSTPTPRKSQGTRKQHRDRRRHFDNVIDGRDDMAELTATGPGSTRKGSNRRQQTNITHLLNYSTPTHHYLERYGHGYIRPRRTGYGPGSGHHVLDKARFVNANYRFVVSPTGGRGDGGSAASAASAAPVVPGASDSNSAGANSVSDTHGYAAQAADPDRHVDWADVQQVIASAESQDQSCPICLSSPVAPRMAKCGHIFCLPCLIRFAHSTSDDEASARKEARWKKCPICEDSFRLPETRPVRFYAGQESPMPRPGEDVVLRLMRREQGSTLALPREGGVDVANEGEDVPWHFAANVLDYARIMKGTDDYLIEQYDREIADLEAQALEDETMFGVEEGDWIQRAIRAIQTVRDKVRGAEPEPGLVHLMPPSSKGKHHARNPYYFYMAPPHLYLAPLDIRILKTRYGDFSDFPSTLLPRVEHISSHTVDEPLRKRAKYLAHLPLGCVVSFLECDWTDLVPEDVLRAFAPDLDRRQKQHLEKAAQEERERLQAERLEASAMGRGPRRQFDLRYGDDRAAAAVVSAEDFVPLGPSPAAGASSPPRGAGFEQLADLPTSPSGESRTVWGTRAVSGPGDAVVAPREEHVDVDDGWLNEDALADAHVAMQLESLSLDRPLGADGGGGGGGRKKKKKITLMSTGGRRGN